MNPEASGWEHGRVVPIVGHVIETDEDSGAVDIIEGEQLTSVEQDKADVDYRILCRELVRWTLSSGKDGAYLRLLVLGLYLCPDEWGNPSQRNMAATHGVLVASLNRVVRDFEKKFGLRLMSARSDAARQAYRKATTLRHQREKSCKQK